MFKYLIEHGYVNVSKLLLQNYKELGLNEVELVIMLKLFEMLKNKKVSISLNELSNKTSMSKDECSNVLNSLLNKGFVTLSVEETNGKNKEVFNLDDFISMIEVLFNSKMKQEMTKANESQIKSNINLVEQTFARTLTPLELQIVNDWTISGETEENITKALAKACRAKKLNIKYVDSCLAAIGSEENEIELDERRTKMLDNLYRKL